MSESAMKESSLMIPDNVYKFVEQIKNASEYKLLPEKKRQTFDITATNYINELKEHISSKKNFRNFVKAYDEFSAAFQNLGSVAKENFHGSREDIFLSGGIISAHLLSGDAAMKKLEEYKAALNLRESEHALLAGIKLEKPKASNFLVSYPVLDKTTGLQYFEILSVISNAPLSQRLIVTKEGKLTDDQLKAKLKELKVEFNEAHVVNEALPRILIVQNAKW